MITSRATHRKENLTNLAIFLVVENGEIGKEVSSMELLHFAQKAKAEFHS